MPKKEGWVVSASYTTGETEEGFTIGIVEEVDVKGPFNIFKIGDEFICVFSDQKRLLNYVVDNEGGLFAVRYLKEGNSKHAYTLDLNIGTITAKTVSEALLLVPSKQGKSPIFNIEEGNKVNIQRR